MKAILHGKDRVMFISVSIYFFIMVYGNAFRFSQEEAALGFSSVLILFIIAPKINKIHGPLFRHPVFLTILYLFIWCLMSSLFSGEGVLKAYIRLMMLFGYLFAAIAVYQMQLTEERIKFLVHTLCISILVASALTIIDYLKIYDIPYVNEVDITTKIGGERVEQAGGFFPRRSAMAAFYSIIIPTLMYYAFKIRNVKEKALMFGASGISFIALLLTHNRSGILGTIFALMLYLYFDKSTKLGRKISIFIYLPIVFGIILYIIYMLSPETLDVYVMKLYRYMPGVSVDAREQVSQSVIESDESRIYFFVSVMKSLLSNPIGNGFSLVFTEKYNYKNPHNIITYIIWAAGLMAFIWLPIFMRQVYRNFSLKRLRGKIDINQTNVTYVAAFQVGLLSWAINNLAHSSLSTGLAWLYLGVVLNIMNKLKNSSSEIPVVAIEPQAESGPVRKKYVQLR